MMSFADEWEQIRADTARERALRTTLAGIASENDEDGREIFPPSPEAAGRGLRVDSEVLDKRANKVASVRSNFRRSDNDAVAQTKKAAASLEGFKAKSGIAKFVERWDEQSKYLDGLLDKGVADGLRRAAVTLEKADREAMR